MLTYRYEPLLSLIILFLLIFQIVTPNISAQQNLEPRRDINVTQDLINLLTQVSKIRNHSEINSETSQFNTSVIGFSNESENHARSTYNPILRDSESLFLEDKHLPEGSVMSLVNTSPFQIDEAQITSRLPCDENNKSAVNVLVGNPPNYDEASMEYLGRFSEESNLCIYKTIITNPISQISELAISNNGTEEIEFPPTSTIMVGLIKLTDTSMQK